MLGEGKSASQKGVGMGGHNLSPGKIFHMVLHQTILQEDTEAKQKWANGQSTWDSI